MPVEQIPIENREQWLALRKRDVTASVAAAVLGAHDYTSYYELWHLKAGTIDEDGEETPAMRRGSRLENFAITMLLEERPELIRVGGNDAYYRDPDTRLGATPDLCVDDPERGRGVIQIKSVHPFAFKKKWRDDDTGEVSAPFWIELQAAVEARLTGAAWAEVVPMVIDAGIDFHAIPVDLTDDVWELLDDQIAEFWRTVAEGIPPDPDYRRDAELLAAEFRKVAPAVIDLTADNTITGQIDSYNALKKQARDAEAMAKDIMAEVHHKVIDAARRDLGRLPEPGEKPRVLVADDRKISWVNFRRKEKLVAAGDVSYLRFPATKPE